MTTFIIILVVLAIVIGIWLSGTEKRVQAAREKEMNFLIPVQIVQLEKYMAKGLGDEELPGLVSTAKAQGETQLMYPRAKYNDMFLASTKDYKDTSTEASLVKCPKCKSTQITASQNGYSAGKGLAGAFLTGGIGLLAGFIGSKDLVVYCMKCGHNWKPTR